MLSTWWGVCRQTTPAPWAGSCSSADRGRTIQSVKAIACRLLNFPSRPELMIRRIARIWKLYESVWPAVMMRLFFTAASFMAPASLMLSAIGFSTTTCFPCSRA